MGKFSVEIKWGFIFSMATLVWACIEKSAHFYDIRISEYAIYTNLFAFIALAVYVFALREKKIVFYKGEMTWKQGFVSGVYLTVVVAVLSPLCQVLIHRYIAPEFLPNLVDYKVASGYLTRKAAEEYFNLETVIYQSSSFALSMGIITGAIVAFFMKTRKKEKV